MATKMIIVKNNIIPFKGYMAITLWPFVFVRRDCAERATERQWNVMVNHESIHCRQQKELLVIPFFLLYVFEWLAKCVYYGNTTTAYYDISFEKEAYIHENDFEYLDRRKTFAEFRS